jgi:hypothetical protein
MPAQKLGRRRCKLCVGSDASWAARVILYITNRFTHGIDWYQSKVGTGTNGLLHVHYTESLTATVQVQGLTLPLNHNLSKLILRRNTLSCLVDSDFVKPSAT